MKWLNENHQEKILEEVFEHHESNETHHLVVFNDNFNTFDHVIQTLVKICRHDINQAEQCTWIIHFKGKCSVKTGSFAKLKPMHSGICDAGINAEIQ